MTPRAQALSRYGNMKVRTATPLDLVVLLLERACADIRRAQAAADKGDLSARLAQLSHARSVVLELIASLDHDQGGEIAAQLAALYGFALDQLAGSASCDGLAAAVEVLGEVLAGYRGIKEGQHARAS